jgi:EAL domain-containing protein (putative c-di-GMP-specific phosphodiesterase class I)
MEDIEKNIETLRSIRTLGVDVAIDDFGTGYSSLSYLQRVPFDLLKIDQIFVRALRQQPPSATLVRTILELSGALGRVAVAEGIEEQIEVDGLLELGCELGQGPLLAPVGDASTIAEWAGIRGSAA